MAKKAAAKKVSAKVGSDRPTKVAKPKTAKKKAPKKKPAKTQKRLTGTAADVPPGPIMPPLALGASPAVLDRLFAVVLNRRNADPAISHSARLLSRGTEKIAQKFGEEAVECLIEAVARNSEALIGESADVLYHMMVMWVDAGIRPEDVWTELHRREGISGVAEKASRVRKIPAAFGVSSTKIP